MERLQRVAVTEKKAGSWRREEISTSEALAETVTHHGKHTHTRTRRSNNMNKFLWGLFASNTYCLADWAAGLGLKRLEREH